MKLLVLAAICALAGTSALAVQPDEFIGEHIRQIFRAYARYAGPLDPQSNQKSLSAQGSDLFPNFGPAPRFVPGLTWSLNRTSDDQSSLCIRQVVNSAGEWNKALQALSRASLSAAAPSGCSAIARQSLAPDTYPSVIAGTLQLDRRDIPSHTRVPAYPVIEGVDTLAVTRPGLRVTAASGPGSFYIYNPFIEVSPGVGRATGISILATRPEFTISHNCSYVYPEQTCEVSVTYTPRIVDPVAGQLFIKFLDGTTANIGLEGRP